MRFKMVPAAGEGELVILHARSPKPLFQYLSGLKHADAVPEEKFEMNLDPEWLTGERWYWGALGEESGGKKFHGLEQRTKEGEEPMSLVPSDEVPEYELLVREGWNFW